MFTLTRVKGGLIEATIANYMKLEHKILYYGVDLLNKEDLKMLSQVQYVEQHLKRVIVKKDIKSEERDEVTYYLGYFDEITTFMNEGAYGDSEIDDFIDSNLHELTRSLREEYEEVATVCDYLRNGGKQEPFVVERITHYINKYIGKDDYTLSTFTQVDIINRFSVIMDELKSNQKYIDDFHSTL